MEDQAGKPSLKTLIKDSQERAAGITVIRRETSFDPTVISRLGKIVTITGPRRAGKTSFMVQIMRTLGLTQDEIVFFDFSDILLSGFTARDFPSLLDAYFELYPDKKPWFFFDEIQEVEDYEKGLKSLLNRDCRIVITGSSAKLFSQDLASALRGKTLPVRIAPLDFREYLRFRNLSLENATSSRERGLLMREFDRFLHFGGFPEVVLTESPETRRMLVKSYVEIMLFRDVVERNHLNNSHLAEKVFYKLLSSFTREISISKWFNDFKSEGMKVSKETLFQYLKYFEETQFITLMQNRAGGPTSQKKVFLADNGLFSPLRSFSPDSGRLLENQVFRDLQATGEPIQFLKQPKGETDFLCKDYAMQVCYQLTNENMPREVAGMSAALSYPGIKKVSLVYVEDARTSAKARMLPPKSEAVQYFDFFDRLKSGA